MTIHIRQIPCLSDNYGYLVKDMTSGAVAAIDTPDTGAINAALDEEGWRLTHILNTHHHWDHTGGNLALKEKWNAQVIGPRGEADQIPGLDTPVADGDTIEFGDTSAIVRDTPGHTLGHIIYHFTDDQTAFVGDTVFALGCGRLFEGTPAQMWASIQRIAAMPPATQLYCAHEYTQANARFCLSLEPNNIALKERAVAIDNARAAGMPTVPTSVAAERATNPFFRADDPALRAALSMEDATNLEVFTTIRKKKDIF